MDALEQLSQYRHVDLVDDRVVDAAIETITAAQAADHKRSLSPRRLTSQRRSRRRHRTPIVAASALAVMAGGCGIAAAAGLFDPPTPLPRAQTFMSSTNPAKVPGARLQLSLPGPEGVTLEVVTDRVSTNNQWDECVALGIIGPDGQAASSHGNAECSGLVAPVGGTVPSPSKPVSPSEALEIWRAPSGTTYDLIFGQSAPGIVKVALTNGAGQVATSQPANAYGYVIYIPAAKFTDYSRLAFSDKSGKIVFSQELNSSSTS